MNVWTGTARLGRDAEVRQTNNGTAVASFAAAADSGFGENKQALWLDCSLFGKRAESGLIQYLVKGKQVALSGEIGTRQFTKRDGTQGFAVTLKVSEVDLVGDKGQGGNQQPQNQGGYGGQHNQGQYNQPQNQQQRPPQNQPPQGQQQASSNASYGAPDPGTFDDFDDEIPFN